MEYPVSHYFLVQSQSGDLAGKHVERYLDNNQLISYSELVVHEEEIVSATDERFAPLLEKGLAANQAFARRMIDHLQAEGIETLDQLLDLQQGYETKILHTLTHLLDGFIGIDSVFYNLIEDSHKISTGLALLMRNEPQRFWLVPVHTGKLTGSVLHPKKAKGSF